MIILLSIIGIILGVILILWGIVSIGIGIASKEQDKQEKDDLWY